MTKAEYIYNTMKDVTNKTPILLIGGAMHIFKMMYKGNIYKIRTTEEVKEFITNFYGVDYDKPIVVEDISLLYRDTMLLKLIEETKIPLILLASEDNMTKQFHSRIKLMIKYPLDLNYKCSFTNILDANDYINNEKLTGKDLDTYIANNCPELALIYDTVKHKKNKDKIIQIIGGLENAKK